MISFEQQAVFDRGHRVGFLAQQLFPGGTDAAWDSPMYFQKSVDLTRKLIEGGAEVIYEAAFLWNDVLVAVDVLVKEDNQWHIFEVKSSLSISETYLRDAALQFYIISKSGLPLSGISIIHLNRDYTRTEYLNLNELFITENITSLAEERIPDVIQGLIRARKTLETGILPDVKIGPHCEIPYTCDFKNYCGWNNMPKQSIFELIELEEHRKWELFDKNILSLKDIPEDFPMSDIQKLEWSSKVSGEVYIDKIGIKKFLKPIRDSKAFLDVQTFRAAIPEVIGTHPYTNVAFGFEIKSAENETVKSFIVGADLKMETDLIKELIKATTPFETILVYDKKRELSALILAADRHPDLKDQIQLMLGKVIDIHDIFSRKLFYHPASVAYPAIRDLPAVFGLDYDAGKVRIGSDSQAGTAFEYLFVETDLFKAEEVNSMLSEYMRANVEALVMVYKALTEL